MKMYKILKKVIKDTKNFKYSSIRLKIEMKKKTANYTDICT